MSSLCAYAALAQNERTAARPLAAQRGRGSRVKEEENHVGARGEPGAHLGEGVRPPYRATAQTSERLAAAAPEGGLRRRPMRCFSPDSTPGVSMRVTW